MARRNRSIVRAAGREWPVLEKRRLGGRTYLILEKLGNAWRRRYRVFDRHGGPAGDFRLLLELPRSRSARQQVRVLKRLSAHNINLPTILDYCIQEKRIVLVLTWVGGPDLESYLHNVRAGRSIRPSPTEAFRLGRGLAHGLAQLHRRHTVGHGDIKPANLILARNPSRLVIIDFGSAWTIERTSRRSKGDGRTPAYAAPELQTGARLPDFRSDQFYASVVLYELLTLQRPYGTLGGRVGRPEFADQLANSLLPPSEHSGDWGRLPRKLRGAIDQVVIKGIALNPARRYLPTSAWLNDLDQVHARMQPQPKLSPRNRRVQRWLTWLTRSWRRA